MDRCEVGPTASSCPSWSEAPSIHGKRIRAASYLNKDRRALRPNAVVAVPTGCLAYWILRIGLGVARRLTDPAVLQTGWLARRTGLGKNPRKKLMVLLLSAYRRVYFRSL